jgi:hypothetical protein
MNRRSILRFLGLAPLAAAVPARCRRLGVQLSALPLSLHKVVPATRPFEGGAALPWRPCLAVLSYLP